MRKKVLLLLYLLPLLHVYGGEGTAVFVANAIEIYCDKAE